MVTILGISGPSSSGKSHFAKKLFNIAKQHKISCGYLTTDEFYLDRSSITYEERTKINYDEPVSINRNEFYEALKKLSNGNEAIIPIYDFSRHTRTNETKIISQTDFLIVEGIFSFSFEEVNELYDFKIYVDYDADLRLIRRIQRDTNERGRTIDSIINQYLKTVRPTQSIYVENDKSKADIVISGGKNHDTLIHTILHSILYVGENIRSILPK